ncbi:MAG: hypothetical protein K5978_04800 [Campylobacter sp.]|nr:hypothetical protein [Campylobacter sp.]
MGRSLFILGFLAVFAFCSSEFIISAELNVKNGVLQTQKVFITPSKIKFNSANFYYFCEIPNPNSILSDLEFTKVYKDKILDCFIGKNTRTKQSITKNGNIVTKRTQLRILPTRFIIDFKPNSAIISVLNYGTQNENSYRRR